MKFSYTPKILSFGFIILCAEGNIQHVRITVKSIKGRYQNVPFICVTDETINTEDFKELEKICPTYKAKNTFSSMINLGFKHAFAEWNILVMAGTSVRQNLDLKMSNFVDSEKDILFPVAERKYLFHEGTINGLMIHKKTFHTVGEWDTNLSLETSKLLWASDAIEKGCMFKAIVGAKLC